MFSPEFVSHLAVWYATNFADPKTRAVIIGGNEIYEFWENPSPASKQRMLDAIKQAGNILTNKPKENVSSATPPTPKDDDVIFTPGGRIIPKSGGVSE